MSAELVQCLPFLAGRPNLDPSSRCVENAGRQPIVIESTVCYLQHPRFPVDLVCCGKSPRKAPSPTLAATLCASETHRHPVLLREMLSPGGRLLFLEPASHWSIGQMPGEARCPHFSTFSRMICKSTFLNLYFPIFGFKIFYLGCCQDKRDHRVQRRIQREFYKWDVPVCRVLFHDSPTLYQNLILSYLFLENCFPPRISRLVVFGCHLRGVICSTGMHGTCELTEGFLLRGM